MALKVFILAKYEPLRVGLVQTLASASDLEVVGNAASLDALPGSIRTGEVDVFVIEIQTLVVEPDWVARLSAWFRDRRVVFLGSIPGTAVSTETLQLLMQQESFGFLSTDGSAALLIDAIRLVAARVFVCDMEVIKPLFGRLERWSIPTERTPPAERLTPREIEVLSLVAEGLANREIARRLVLSEGTVKAHISHIMSRLDIEQRAGLVRYAFNRDLPLPPETGE